MTIFSKKKTTEGLIKELEENKQKLEYLLVHVNLLKNAHKIAFNKTHIKEQRFLIMNQLQGLVHEMSKELEKISKSLAKKIDFENIKEHEEEISKFNEDYKRLINDINEENEYHKKILEEINKEEPFEDKEKNLEIDLEKGLKVDNKIIEDLQQLNKDVDENLKELKNINQNFNRKELNKILNNYSIEKLINFFKLKFNDLFLSDVGVWERYTLEEHTKLVLTQFEKYFSNNEIFKNISIDFFRVFLAVHDIGKPIAVKNGNKKLEHEETSKIIKELFKELEFEEKDINLALSLLNGDPIGDFLKSSYKFYNSLKILNFNRNQSGLTTIQYFNLLLIYYKCDAGSYTEDSGGKKSLDHLFSFGKELNFSEQNEKKINLLKGFFLIDIHLSEEDIKTLLNIKYKLEKKSSDSSERLISSKRNKEILNPIKKGSLIHGVKEYKPEILKSILQNGLLCAEFIGKAEDSETYLHLDLLESNVNNIEEWQSKLNNSSSAYIPGFGFSIYGQIRKYLAQRRNIESNLIRRISIIINSSNHQSWNSEQESRVNDIKSKFIKKIPIKLNNECNQVSILGGVASTDIHGIIISDGINLNEIVKILNEENMYIPVFDAVGKKIY